MSKVFYLAETDAIVAPCCVVPDIGGPPNRHLLLCSSDSEECLAAGKGGSQVPADGVCLPGDVAPE